MPLLLPALILTILALLCLLFISSTPLISPWDSFRSSTRSPDLTGTPLLIASTLARLPVLGTVIARHLKNDEGIHRVRRWAAESREKSVTFEPVMRFDAGEQAGLLGVWMKQKDGVLGKFEGMHGFATMDSYRKAYAEGSETPGSVMDKVLRGMREADGELHAVAECDEKDVVRQAKESTERLRAGKPRSAFEGVPVLFKEEFRVRGYNVSCGTTFLREEIGWGQAQADDAFVARMRAAGFIIAGTTQMHEYAIGVSGNNPSRGSARNPHDFEHYAGGSSSGSGVVVAAGLVPVAIGSDSGGSIRIPASFCGTVGFKPTFGRVGSYYELGYTLGAFGPFSASVRDAALVYEVMAGVLDTKSGKRDPSFFQPPVHLANVFIDTALKGLRVGVLLDFTAEAADDVKLAFHAAMDALKRDGAVIVPLQFPHMDVLASAHSAIITSEFAATSDGFWKTRRFALSPESASALAFGREVSAMDYIASARVRAWAGRYAEENIWTKCDVLLLPSTGVSAPKIPANGVRYGHISLHTVHHVFRYMLLANMLGNPAGVVPFKKNDANLPLAVQVMGKNWCEHQVLRVMRRLELLRDSEKKTNWGDGRPKYFKKPI